MEVEFVNRGKNEFEVRVDNLTVAEVLRAYLNKNGIDFAAWRREHPTKPIIFKVKSSGKTVKKEISEAVSLIKKELSGIQKILKK